ncbi:hypothetical protein SJAG_02621 [Schizosaccharomyces japonicus yFS275]|uniref:Argonaute n=1 Tax=Schizosaccharomyces japonicus (strain yFS275 / FY16936) TaxID=402676 RepID=B6K0R2_SCHJY|nr:hypothetical protein SJAG_02621 [Schizosaccharomyces japonicus yFS275]EEB07533.1 hypothetical protein SJAG_02621 [Schizosaccharomyces japonicus yFS275]
MKPKTDLVLRSNYDKYSKDGYGTIGRPITLLSNFYRIENLPNDTIYQYHVVIGDGTRVPRKLVNKIWNSEDVKKFLKKSWKNCVFDGRSLLFSKDKIEDGATDVVVDPDRPERKVAFAIQRTSNINLETVTQFVQSRYSLDPQVLGGIMFLDLLLKKTPSETLYGFNRSFFTGNRPYQLGGGLDAWKGFYQSIRPGQGFMTVNIDVCTSAFWREDSLLRVLLDYTNRHHPNDLERMQLAAIGRRFRLLKVTCQHRNNAGTALSKKQYSIERFSSGSALDETFLRRVPNSDKEERISVADYFLEHHNVRLEFPNLPCAIIKNGAKLPLELCYIVKGQRYSAKLNSNQTAQMIRFACQRPHERVKDIEQFVHSSAWDKDPNLKEYGMRISRNMLDVPARILDAPRIMYHDDYEHPRDGRWNLRGKRFLITPDRPVRSWAVVCFLPTRILPNNKIENFLRTYVNTLTGLGISFECKNPRIYRQDPRGNLEGLLGDVIKKTADFHRATPDYLFFILDSNSPEPYATIKRLCNTKFGIPSQCALRKHIEGAKPQYCANLGMKVNAKLGGVNVHLEPKSFPLGNIPTIILGGDVYHPARGGSGASIGSMVGSIDLHGCKYTAMSRAQNRNQEMIQGMKDMVVYFLQGFRHITKKEPAQIIYFRDGVSDGQFKQVVDEELAEIKQACYFLSPKYKPRILVCSTQKRHHARFFVKKPQDGDRNGNPKPGTIVEKVVTHPFEYDFYLVSHPSLQGVSVPIHYTVLYDEIKMPPDQFQSLCYNLCYVYARATTAVSLVPPVYYAHLLSNMARFQDDTAKDDASSVASGATEPEEVKPLRKVAPSLKTKMWFM